MFNGKTVLVTGGTGSFGELFTVSLFKKYKPKKVIIFSRDEYKQFWMAKKLARYASKLRFFLGDVRDLPRLRRAFAGVDVVVHAAALKQVPALEYNPFEAVKTNVLGSQNVVDAAIDAGVGKVLLISSDKAVQPVNLYGATKLCAEKLFIASNVYSPKTPLFSVVRYGNVVGSRGSIVEKLMLNKTEVVEITNEKMTRFWLSLTDAFNLVEFAIKNMVGGEVFVPKISSMKVQSLLHALAPAARQKIIGIRPGEKLHEMLLSPEEAARTIELKKYFIVLPSFDRKKSKKYSVYRNSGKSVSETFSFRSDTNSNWMTEDSLLDIAKSLKGKPLL